MQIAEMVKRDGRPRRRDRKVEPTDDLRSYHVSSEKISRELGFDADATRSRRPCATWSRPSRAAGCPNSLDDPRYFNIKTMQNISLK